VIEIAEDANFTTIIETATISENSYTQNIGLSEDGVYFWRIQSKNECGEGVFTAGNSFSTGFVSCLKMARNIPNPIISTLTTSSTINISDDIPISDINISVNIIHPYIGDLVIDVVSPSGTSITLIASKCEENDDMSATFDDSGEELITCTPTPIIGLFGPSIDGVFKPTQALSAFNGESSLGSWTLNVTDTGLGDDGLLTSWSIEYCGVQEVVLSTQLYNDLSVVMYPNPVTDFVSFKFEDSSKLKVTLFDLLGRKVLSKILSNDTIGFDVSNLSSGSYTVQIQNENNEKLTKKLIVN
jgi:subtilisin-like proprotein convertase family protein